MAPLDYDVAKTEMECSFSEPWTPPGDVPPQLDIKMEPADSYPDENQSYQDLEGPIPSELLKDQAFFQRHAVPVSNASMDGNGLLYAPSEYPMYEQATTTAGLSSLSSMVSTGYAAPSYYQGECPVLSFLRNMTGISDEKALSQFNEAAADHAQLVSANPDGPAFTPYTSGVSDSDALFYFQQAVSAGYSHFYPT